jgi:hypothetical protein
MLQDAGWNFKRLNWLFGCPGHGKGVWNGLGGVIKSKLFRAILKYYEVFGQVNEEKKNLYEWAKKLFAEYPEVEGKTFKTISKWNIEWQDVQSTVRPSFSEGGKKIRDSVQDIKAFKEIHRSGLGTHDLFEFEVSDKCTADNTTLIVS